MDRVIEVKINGNHLSKDNNLAGVQGEANATYLRIEFDEGWDGYAKTLLWLDARGEKTTGRILTADLLEDVTESARIYLAPIPGEALTVWGDILFAVDGYINGKRQKSAYGRLRVKPGDEFAVLEDVTPSQAEQLQAQIDNLLGDMQEQAVIAHNAAATATQKAAEAAESEENAQQAATEAQAAQEATADMLNRAVAIAQNTEKLAQQAEKNALAAVASAQGAEESALAAKGSETKAAASAAAAYNSEQTAVSRAQEADAAAERAENARDGVEQSERYSAQSAAAALKAEEGAKAAQKAAEAARDAAGEIAGGDFATHTEVQEYAATAESNANAYTDRKFETIPTPDVSVQIGAHDSDTGSHEDIRSAVGLAAAAAAEAAAAAATAQRTADGAASGSQAAQAVANSAHDVADAAREAENGAVKKSGDTMTGALGVTSLDFVNDRMYGSISPEGSMAKMQIIVGDKVAGGDCMLEIMPGGLRFTDTDYIERTVIHTGNLAQYMGVAQASLE